MKMINTLELDYGHCCVASAQYSTLSFREQSLRVSVLQWSGLPLRQGGAAGTSIATGVGG